MSPAITRWPGATRAWEENRARGAGRGASHAPPTPQRGLRTLVGPLGGTSVPYRSSLLRVIPASSVELGAAGHRHGAPVRPEAPGGRGRCSRPSVNPLLGPQGPGQGEFPCSKESEGSPLRPGPSGHG